MFVELGVGYTDTGADELGWSVELGPVAALASRRLEFPGLSAELRLLGASHQMTVWPSDRSASGLGVPICTETVACLPGETEPLPRLARRELSGWAYTIESVVRDFSSTGFSRRVERIGQAAPWGLVGRYPGPAGALTAIAVQAWRHGLRWMTWHTYPQDLRIATTLSLLRRVGADGECGAGARRGGVR